MIEIITGTNKNCLSKIETDMFRQRANVFHQQLGWDVKVNGGLEIDEFDRPDTVYLVSMDERGDRVTGGLRLMPTTTPHMMQTSFASMFPDYAAVESPLIWECTRFFIDMQSNNQSVAKHGLNTTTTELLVGLVEFGVDNGISQILGMFDSRMLRIYRRAGLPPELLDTCKHGRMTLMVGLWDINSSVLDTCRRANGIHTSLFPNAHAPIHIQAA